jgi:hypothetical protein
MFPGGAAARFFTSPNNDYPPQHPKLKDVVDMS